MAKPDRDIMNWMKGHLDAQIQLNKAHQQLFGAHKLTAVVEQIQEAQYALMRARNALEKAGG